MKKAVFLIMFLSMLTFLSASPTFYLRSGYEFSLDTNIFSYPLTRYGDDAFLKRRTDNPFYYRLSHGLGFKGETYFSAQSRIGLSFSFSSYDAIKAKEYKPSTLDSTQDWQYIKSDITDDQKTAFFFSIGPSFRAILKKMDITANVRLSLGSFDYFDNSLIFSLTNEMGMNVFITEDVFLFTSLTLTSHILNFYLKDQVHYYRSDFVLATLQYSIGCGFKFGKRGGV